MQRCPVFMGKDLPRRVNCGSEGGLVYRYWRLQSDHIFWGDPVLPASPFTPPALGLAKRRRTGKAADLAGCHARVCLVAFILWFYHTSRGYPSNNHNGFLGQRVKGVPRGLLCSPPRPLPLETACALRMPWALVAAGHCPVSLTGSSFHS